MRPKPRCNWSKDTWRVLVFVPMRCRSRWPMRRWYWQAEDLARADQWGAHLDRTQG